VVDCDSRRSCGTDMEFFTGDVPGGAGQAHAECRTSLGH
jgi:hypothetical protein